MCSQLLVFLLCALIFGCFTYEIAVIKPNWLDILKGLLPKPSVRTCFHSYLLPRISPATDSL